MNKEMVLAIFATSTMAANMAIAENDDYGPLPADLPTQCAVAFSSACGDDRGCQLPEHVTKVFEVPPYSWPAAFDSSCAILCDLDGDGVLDAISASGTPESSVVLRGNGDGTFTADRNGDDIIQEEEALKLQQDFGITVGQGVAADTLSALELGAWTFDTDGIPLDLTCCDLNCDGNLDVVIVTRSGFINVILGDGTLNLDDNQVLSFDVGGELAAVECADLNNDSKLDLVIADQLTWDVVVALGNGNGTFGEDTDADGSLGALEDDNNNGLLDLVYRFESGRLTTDVAVADFNGDGNPDVAASNQLDDCLTIYINNGNGTFGEDLNGNGLPDFPQAEFTTELIAEGAALLGIDEDDVREFLETFIPIGNGEDANGNGEFDIFTKIDLGAITGPREVITTDFNCDGIADLAVVNEAAETVLVYLGNGDGTFALGSTIGAGGSTFFFPSALNYGDFNGDGFVDLVVVDVLRVQVFLNDGAGAFSPDTDNFHKVSAGGETSCIAVGDLNGDANADIAFGDFTKNRLVAFLNNYICAPTLIPGEDCILVNAGEDVTITCNFTGGMPQGVVWLRNGSVINTSFGQFSASTEIGTASLTITNVTSENTDAYTAIIATEAGEIECTTVLAVRNPCSVDMNGDGVLNIGDVLDFLGLFQGGISGTGNFCR